jgi:hypothetical protein
MIDFSELALSPNESRAARNFLGLSQAQAATKSNLPAHKLKRFESGNYVPDAQFLEDLRDFYESEGFKFHDELAPGAKAKASGDVFPAGVVGETGGSPSETDGSPSGKLGRFQSASVQYMRISPSLNPDQVDRILECIEENEAAISAAAGQAITTGFLTDAPSGQSQAQAIAALRRLAEIGLLHARLLGRDLLPPPTSQDPSSAETIGDLLHAALGDMQRAVVGGDKEALARRKARQEPSEVLEALIG